MTKEGIIEKVIFYNKDNGYTVADFDSGDEEMTIVGFFSNPAPGMRFRVDGDYSVHRKYGPQFQVAAYEELKPDDEELILEYLSGGGVRGVGPKMAEQLVERFGIRTLEIMEEEPEKLLQIRGIGPAKLKLITESLNGSKESANASIELQKLGFTAQQAVQIYKLYGTDAPDLIRENPYRAIRDVRGLTFKTVDGIAARMGFEMDSDCRIQAGIEQLMWNFMQNGSTYIPEEYLLDGVVQFLDVSSERIRENLLQMAFDGRIQTDLVDSAKAVYLETSYIAEQEVAQRLRQIRDAHIDAPAAEFDHLIADAETWNLGGIRLSDEQQSAVHMALTENVSIITGGPGTGKTTIINTIVHILTRLGQTIALAAPTGRAAKRMTETSGVPAVTIHRLLECVKPDDDGAAQFERDEDNPLEEQVVIVDEASMIDLFLADALLRAIRPGTRLIFVGDADQLPSVGPGNVLRDMIRSEFIPTAELKEIFRQEHESEIVVNAHRIHNGEYPMKNSNESDFFIFERERGIPIADEQTILEKVVELVGQRLPDAYDFINDSQDVQVLTPMKKTLIGTRNLNDVLQRTLNPAGPERPELRYEGRVFREGDKVMQIVNDYEKEWKRDGDTETSRGVFNGDLGRIEYVDSFSGSISVRFEDRLAVYQDDELDSLELAYAITVHKSQGCEFPAVVMPVIPNTGYAPGLLTRNLLYTGITRGKKLVVLVGPRECVNRMVDNNRVDDRCTGLSYRLREIEEEENFF